MTNYKEMTKEELMAMEAEMVAQLNEVRDAIEAKKTDGINMGDHIVILYGKGKVENKDKVECIVHGITLDGLTLKRVDGKKIGGRIRREFTRKDLLIVG